MQSGVFAQLGKSSVFSPQSLWHALVTGIPARNVYAIGVAGGGRRKQIIADVVKLVYTLASGASSRKGVRVQVSPSAPRKTNLERFVTWQATNHFLVRCLSCGYISCKSFLVGFMVSQRRFPLPRTSEPQNAVCSSITTMEEAIGPHDRWMSLPTEASLHVVNSRENRLLCLVSPKRAVLVPLRVSSLVSRHPRVLLGVLSVANPLRVRLLKRRR